MSKRMLVVAMLVAFTILITGTALGSVDAAQLDDQSVRNHPPNGDGTMRLDGVGRTGNAKGRGENVRARGINRTNIQGQVAGTTLSLQEARSSDSDQGTVAYSFEVAGNESQQTSVSVSPGSDLQSGGDVTFEFESWTDITGGGSGTSQSFTATGGHRYRVEYSVEAQSGASEGTYSITASASTGNGNTYTSQLDATVEILSPSFGSISDRSTRVVFDEYANSESQTVSVEIPNTGEGVLLTETASFSNVPNEFSVTEQSLPDEIAAGTSDNIDLEITVEDSVPEGSESFGVAIEDTLGNTERFTVTVEVSKPPIVTTSPGTVDVDDILVGGSASSTVTVSELAGYDSINDLDVEVRRGENEASLDVSSLSGLDVGAGQQASRDISVSLSETASQGADLNWNVIVKPSEEDAPSSTFDVTANVIYPPYYDNIEAPDTELIYDRPRSEATAFTTRVDVGVTNGGDLPMELESVTATGTSPVSATVVDAPDTIGPRNEGDVTIELSGDPSADEQTVTYELTLSSNEPISVPGLPTGEQTVTGEVTINQRADIEAQEQTLQFGEVSISEERTRSTTISERLEYEDVQDFSFRRIDGPDRWFEVIDSPSSLRAGESAPFLVAVEFDANATLYQTYEWTFRVDGENVESEKLTVQATPRPVQCTATKDELAAYQGSDQTEEVASTMVEAIEVLETRLRESPGEGPISDLTRACTAGRGALVFLNARQQAQSLIQAGNQTGAQQSVVRMAAGYNIMANSLNQLETADARELGEQSTDGAEAVLNDRLQSQFDYYTQRVNGSNTTVLRSAGIYRRLATLASLRGDSDQAQEFRQQSDSAFSRYDSLISSGNEHLQAARDAREQMDQTLLFGVSGVRVFWIGSLDQFQSFQSTIQDEYTSAAEAFATSGATGRAQTTRQEQQRVAQKIQQVYILSIVVGAGIVILLLLTILYEARELYRYIQDSRATTSGDFLL